MQRVLLIDNDAAHASDLGAYLHRTLRVSIVIVESVQDAIVNLKSGTSRYEVAIINASDPQQSWGETLQRLHEACLQARPISCPKFLCLTRQRREPLFVLNIEHMGARYVHEA